MKIVVTGGCGFIGSHVVELLVKEGNTVTVLDNLCTGKSENLEHIQATRGKLKVELCDIRQINSLRGFFQEAQPEAVIHLAAQAAITTSWKAPYLDAHVNVMGTLNVIKMANDYHAKRMVFASTSAVYGPKRWGRLKETDIPKPDSPYGLTKRTAENYLRMLFPDSTVLRFGNVYGPRQVPIGENQVIARMISHFETGTEFRIHGDGKQTRDYVFAADAADAVAQGLHGKIGTYNIASGKSLSVMDVAHAVSDIYDVAFYPWEHDRAVDERRFVNLGVRAAARELMWRAKTPFREGLQETIKWWNEAKHD